MFRCDRPGLDIQDNDVTTDIMTDTYRPMGCRHGVLLCLGDGAISLLLRLIGCALTGLLHQFGDFFGHVLVCLQELFQLDPQRDLQVCVIRGSGEILQCLLG